MAQQQSKSIWVWASLLLMLGAFVAFVLFLDQELANTGSSKQQQPEKSVAPNKPIIDFYSILPERELEISIPEEDRAAIENPTINKQVVGKSILQVGSFQSSGEADSLKAQLAFLGLEANVKPALVDDTTWHRVQIGPFASETGLSRAINLLIENKVPYMQRSAP
jgi:cell division protein FtsN